jgi:hypothetical protein
MDWTIESLEFRVPVEGIRNLLFLLHTVESGRGVHPASDAVGTGRYFMGT